jgi:Flp pilus assembly protein TadD
MLGPLEPRRYMPKARTAALNALEIDETLAEARAALAFVKWHYEWDWSGAERELRRILTFHPRDALARQWLALLLAEQGRYADAIKEATGAQRLEPSSPSTRANLATVLLFAGRHDRAIEEARRTLMIDPVSARAHFVIGIALEAQRQPTEAIAQFGRGLAAAPHAPGLLGSAGHSYGIAGMKPEAMHVLRQLEALPHGSAVGYAKALTFVGMGETKRAVEWLERAWVERDFQLVLLKVDRRMDRLRADSKFQLVAKRIGLSD